MHTEDLLQYIGQNPPSENVMIGSTSDSSLPYEEAHRQFVTFRLNQGHFAVDIREVREIITAPRITKLPSVSSAVSGIISLRGQIVTLINTKSILNIDVSDEVKSMDAIIFQNKGMSLGILVDEVLEVIQVEDGQIEDAPVTIHGNRGDLVTAVVRASGIIVSLINPNNFFNHPEIHEEKINMNNVILDSARSDQESTVQLVSFLIGDDEFAVDIHEVQEINKMITITQVPRAPRFVEGIINLRGQIVPVINLRERFKLEKIGHDKNTRIIIINVDNKRVGLIVDSVSEVMRVSALAIKNPPTEAVGEGVTFVKGVAEKNGRLIIVLHLDKVLSQNEVANVSKIKSAIRESEMKTEQTVPANGNGSLNLGGLRKSGQKYREVLRRKKKIAVLD